MKSIVIGTLVMAVIASVAWVVMGTQMTGSDSAYTSNNGSVRLGE